MTDDRHDTAPLPDPAAQWMLVTPDRPAPAQRRRARWPWIVAGVAVVVLAIVAWVAGEQIARNVVESTIRERVVTELSLPADQPIGVDIPGQILPQLIGGTLDEITVTGDDVTFGELSGDVTVHATGVPVRGDAPLTAATATVTLDEAQLTALLGTIEGFPADTVAIDAPAVEVSMELQLFALTVPVGVTLVPGAAGGDIVLTPSTLRVAGAEITADALVRQFGAIAGTVVRDWQVCVADQLPAGVELSAVDVTRTTVVAEFAIDGDIVTDEALRRPGSCE
ncbi:LmeA family phospholipid-binding protein [Microbacterium sp. MC2]